MKKDDFSENSGGNQSPDKPPGKGRRSWRNIRFLPSNKLRLFFSALIALLLFAIFIALDLINRISLLQSAELQMESPVKVVSQLSILVGILLLLASGSLFFSILFSHRIFGPMVPILRHIRMLSSGDYSQRIRIRKGDEFGEIVDALNELTEKLAKR